MSKRTPHTAAATDESQTVSRPRAARRLRRAGTYYVIALASALLIFVVLAAFAYRYPYFTFDVAATRLVQSFDPRFALGFMRFVSFFGNGITPHVIAAVTCVLFLLFRRRSEAAGLLLSTGGSALINSLLKLVVARPRPTAALVQIFAAPGSLSFPSGHVTFYVCYFGFLFFAAYAVLPRASLSRCVALPLAALPVLLVGVSRVYLGAHWLSDTVGAYLWSGVWLAFSLEMYRRWKARATFHQGSED